MVKGETVTLPMEGQCNSGDEIEARLELDATLPCRYLMVEEPVPAGMEMILPEDDATLPAGIAQVEYFPDKIVFYLEKLPDGVARFSYSMRAIFPGVYQVLPAHVESMYVPEIQGYSCGERVKIKK